MSGGVYGGGKALIVVYNFEFCLSDKIGFFR